MAYNPAQPAKDRISVENLAAYPLIDAAEIVRSSIDASEFALSLQTRDAPYLLLNISSNDEDDLMDCSLKN